MIGKVEGTFGFGDGAQKPALFKALQVPPFYKRKSSSQCCILFVNITIVENEVGLLDGKIDLAAFKMRLQLDPNPGKSRFWLMDQEIEVEDKSSHYWLLLDVPRPFLAEDIGFSLPKADGKAFAKYIFAKSHHHKRLDFDTGVSDNDISEYRGHLKSDDDTVSLLNGDVFLPNSIDFCEKQNADGKAFVEHVLPEAHHHFNSKYDAASLLDFDLDEQTSLQK